MAFVISGLVGVDLTDVQTTANAKFAVGTVVQLSDGGKATYVRALSTIAQFDAVGINAANAAFPLETTNALTTKKVGFAQTAIASASYGWVHTAGIVKVNLALNCDDNVPLYATSTGGVLDDATVSGLLVGGITSTVTISNATAVTCIAAGGFVVTGATPA